MRITVTQEFNTAEEAAGFLARIGNPVVVINHLIEPTAPPSTNATEPTDKPARKPRADRGQRREPYGPRTTTGEPAASEPGVPQADSATSAPAAPATPTISSAPTPAVQPGATPGPAPAAEEFPATLDGARKAMKALDGTQGKGMEACIAALKAHGVTRISDLKTAEQFAPFIKDVLEQSSPEGIETARKWAGGQVAKK